jgi:site-specific recombinase XerC
VDPRTAIYPDAPLELWPHFYCIEVPPAVRYRLRQLAAYARTHKEKLGRGSCRQWRSQTRREPPSWRFPALVDRLGAGGHSPSTIHNVLMPVRVLCRYAIERDELLVNPTTNLRVPVANGRRERVASPQEAAALIEALPSGSAIASGTQART